MLILLDNNEENLFNLEQEINETGTNINVKPTLGDIRDRVVMDKLFADNRPQVVLHAAAYKHVPIQELNPWYAVLTNVSGTQNIVELASTYKAEKFILVSTDKAVHPVNVMGATKRLSERIIQIVDKVSHTQYMAVRFGNVIGSSGSVIPTLKRQIKKGGPVTITHPDMTRYFMSIPEAAQLILQTGAIGRG
jgi:FlaA1/EpsC-like NDP-sugar epimerase